jgi:hypothetical protein
MHQVTSSNHARPLMPPPMLALKALYPRGAKSRQEAVALLMETRASHQAKKFPVTNGKSSWQSQPPANSFEARLRG